MGLKDLLSKYEKSGDKQYDDKKIPFLSLKNNGDSALVRFLVKDIADLEQYVFEVHKTKIGDFDNKVLCIGQGCQYCSEKRPSPTMLIPVWNITTGELQVWQRGLNEIKGIINLIEKYGKKFGDLQDCIFEIKRNGAKGDTNTSYNILFEDNEPLDEVEKLKADLPPLVGRNFRYVLKLTKEQQEFAILNGKIEWKANEVVEEELPF